MTYIATTILLVLSFSVLEAQTRIDGLMRVDSVQRQFIVSVPTGQAPGSGYPLVFVFHGTSQDGEKFYTDSQWKEKGETEKFISVFPTALEYCIEENGSQHTTTKWHNGELDEIACPGQYLKDDRHFVRAMIDSIAGRYPVNARKIYATGFSNGAGFASKLAVDMSDVFAAAGVSGGSLSSVDSAAPKANIPYWLVVGTKDDRWIEPFLKFGITELPFNDSTIVMLSPLMNRILTVFNLSQTFTKVQVGRSLTYIFNTPSSSETTTEFRFTLINDMFHVYPDGSNVPYKAADTFWDFFNLYSLPVSVASTPPSPLNAVVYPNPAKDYLVVDGAGEATLTLRNILGQAVFRAHVQKGALMMLPRLTRGIYAAEIVSGRDRVLKTVAIR